MKRHIPQPKSPIFTAGEQQSFRFPVRDVQPVRLAERRIQPLIYTETATSGTVVQPLYLFPTSQPQYRRTYRVATKSIPRSARLELPSSQAPPWFQVVQPDSRRISEQAQVRYRADLVEALHQGGTPVNLDHFLVFKEPLIARLSRPILGTVLPILGAPAAPTQTQLLPVTVMPSGYVLRTNPKMVVRQISGPTPAVPVVPNPIGPAIQPLDRWYRLRGDRRIVEAAKRLDGATVQQLFLYPIDQPSRRGWYVPRLAQFSAPPLRVEGTPNLQIDLAYFRQPDQPIRQVRLEQLKQLTGVFTPPATPQSYVFQPNQPDRRGYYVPRLNLWVVGFANRLEGAAPVAPQLHPMPTILGPDRSWWTKTRFGAQVHSAYTPVEFIGPLIEGDRHRFVLYVKQELVGDLYLVQDENHNLFVMQLVDFDTER